MNALPLGILKHMEKDGALVVVHQLRPHCMERHHLLHRVSPREAVGGEEWRRPERTALGHGRRCGQRKRALNNERQHGAWRLAVARHKAVSSW